MYEPLIGIFFYAYCLHLDPSMSCLVAFLVLGFTVSKLSEGSHIILLLKFFQLVSQIWIHKNTFFFLEGPPFKETSKFWMCQTSSHFCFESFRFGDVDSRPNQTVRNLDRLG